MDIYPQLDAARPLVYLVEYRVDYFRYKRYSFDLNEILSFANSKAHNFIGEGFEVLPVVPRHSDILFKSEYHCDGESVRKIKIKEIMCLEGEQPKDAGEEIYLYSVKTHIRGAGKIEAYSTSLELLHKTKEETNARILNNHKDHIWSEKTPLYGNYICHTSLLDKTNKRFTISYACTKLKGRARDEETNPRYRVILSIVKMLEREDFLL